MTKPAKLQAVCAVCFNTHKLYANGNLVRHGFEIVNRRVGEYNNAWHTGPCDGINFPHFGKSTEGSEWALGCVRDHLAHLKKHLKALEGRPSLTWVPGRHDERKGLRPLTIQPGAEGDRYAKFADHVTDWSGNPHETFSRPSYDALLANRITDIKSGMALAKNDIAMYERAIETWKPQDPTPVKPEVKKHKRSTWKRTQKTAPLCKQWTMREPFGTYAYAKTDEEISCSSCLRSMAAAEKARVKHAKRVERALTVAKGAGRALLAEMVELGREPASYNSSAMYRLQDAGLVESAGGHSPDGWTKPYYVPTDAGRAALQAEGK